jgi:hypothetical protein
MTRRVRHADLAASTPARHHLSGRGSTGRLYWANKWSHNPMALPRAIVTRHPSSRPLTLSSSLSVSVRISPAANSRTSVLCVMLYSPAQSTISMLALLGSQDIELEGFSRRVRRALYNRSAGPTSGMGQKPASLSTLWKDSRYSSGRSPHWIKSKNPNAPAVKREAEEDWGRWSLARPT